MAGAYLHGLPLAGSENSIQLAEEPIYTYESDPDSLHIALRLSSHSPTISGINKRASYPRTLPLGSQVHWGIPAIPSISPDRLNFRNSGHSDDVSAHLAALPRSHYVIGVTSPSEAQVHGAGG